LRLQAVKSAIWGGAQGTADQILAASKVPFGGGVRPTADQLLAGSKVLTEVTIEAVKQKTIDCRIVDVSNMAEAEEAENEFRKSPTLSERAQLALMLEEDAGGTTGSGGDRKSEEAKSNRPEGDSIENGAPKKPTHPKGASSSNGASGQGSRSDLRQDGASNGKPTQAEIAVNAGLSGHQELDRVSKIPKGILVCVI